MAKKSVTTFIKELGTSTINDLVGHILSHTYDRDRIDNNLRWGAYYRNMTYYSIYHPKEYKKLLAKHRQLYGSKGL